VTFTATIVSNTGAIPTGTVTFKHGSTTLGTGTIDGTGHATFSTTALPAGPNPVNAVYGGSSNFVGSASLNTNQKVNVNPSFTGLSSSQNPSAKSCDWVCDVQGWLEENRDCQSERSGPSILQHLSACEGKSLNDGRVQRRRSTQLQHFASLCADRKLITKQPRGRLVRRPFLFALLLGSDV
jgi:hypothetical protein